MKQCKAFIPLNGKVNHPAAFRLSSTDQMPSAGAAEVTLVRLTPHIQAKGATNLCVCCERKPQTLKTLVHLDSLGSSLVNPECFASTFTVITAQDKWIVTQIKLEINTVFFYLFIFQMH